MNLPPYDHTKDSVDEATGLTSDVIDYTIMQLQSNARKIAVKRNVTTSELVQLFEEAVDTDEICKRVIAYLALEQLLHMGYVTASTSKQRRKRV